MSVVSPFDPFSLKGLELKNRFVMAAAASPFSADENGILNPAEIPRISRIAAGGIGLFINGAVLVHPSGQTRKTSCTITSDAGIPAFRNLTDAVHRHGAKIACQLCHSGIWAAAYQGGLGREAVGASVIHDGAYAGRPDFPQNYHAATDDEIKAIAGGFGEGAARAVSAGFDAVEVHGAHDSLLAQFLSPLSNRRSDVWGGSLENRTRFHRLVAQEIRSAVGPDYPVILKLGAADAVSGGLAIEEGLRAAQICRDAGYDLLEVSMGLQGADFMKESVLRGPIKKKEEEGFTRAWCRRIHQEAGIPTIMTGGLRSLDLVEEVLATGETDLVGLCRPLIREPDLINRWKAGDRRKATCISCNLCVLKPKGEELACSLEAEED